MNNEKELSIFKLLISILVLTNGLLGLALLMVPTVETNCMSRDSVIVSHLGKEKLEFYENSSLLPALPFEEVESSINGIYNRHTIILDNVIDSLIPEGLCHIQVTINWVDNSGVSRNSVYSTLLGKG